MMTCVAYGVRWCGVFHAARNVPHTHTLRNPLNSAWWWCADDRVSEVSACTTHTHTAQHYTFCVEKTAVIVAADLAEASDPRPRVMRFRRN